MSTSLSINTQSPVRRHGMLALGLAVLAIIVILPWFASQFVLHLAVLTALNVLVVNGLALISRSGQLSLGHAAFIAIGAYVGVLASQHFGLAFWSSALVGTVATAIIALVLGWIILRLKGVYFVLVTFAFGELVRLVLLDFSAFTGGANGITGIDPAALLGFTFDTRASFYALALVVALLSVLIMHGLFRSPLGHAIDSVADNAGLAESTGLSVHRLQVFAFVCGCAMAAFGGNLLARYIGYISPESFNISISVGLIIMLVIGGRRSNWGPLVGAIVLTPLPELFRGAVQTQHIFYGAALILILRFLPGGLAALPQAVRSLATRRNP
ncbi:branched-chain amino acid ABC transporter permease [Pusillimonas sp. ANT_WB101]|uniref:branched-chain amino acid ABC transporter permease n=1 Tax=Pusillimonas sp. ANT_WB101 TaxID=2597356 RepID=UPI00165E5DC2|nr:branched-chain amino acid ABC transporter permease [Pusillimonas sp. ANT_WB101]